METAATNIQEIIMDKIAKLYPTFRVKAIMKSGEEYIVDIDYDVNIPGSGHNQKWVVENDKAVFLGTIFKQSAYSR